MNDDQKFELKRSISATPDGGSPGETILIQVVDFPINQAIMNVQLGGQTVCGSGPKHANADIEDSIPASCGGVADQTGSDNFAIVIPNWVRAGRQELRVVGSDKKAATTNVDLIGPQIAITPKTVLANQRISLVGTGFSPGAVIANADDPKTGSVTPEMSVGGDPIGGGRINDSDPVRVDNGGNWSASVGPAPERGNHGGGRPGDSGN